MENVVTAPTNKEPNFFQTLIGYGKVALNKLQGTYIIEVTQVSIPPVPSTPATATSAAVVAVPEAVASSYLILKENQDIDFTDNIKKATQFNFIYGATILKNLKTAMQDKKNIQVSMISASDTALITAVSLTNNPKP